MGADPKATQSDRLGCAGGRRVRQGSQMASLLALLSLLGASRAEDYTPPRPKFHFTPRFGWTNDPNGMNWAPNSKGKIVQHLYYQANPNSTSPPWSGGPANCPAWWGHATSTFGEPGDLVRWTEVECSAIRGGSGAILPVPEKMQQSVGDGVKAIAFGGIDDGVAFWTTTDPDQICCWQPPRGCVDTGPPNGSYTCNRTAMHPNRPRRAMLPKDVVAGASMGDPTAAWHNKTDGKLYGVFASSQQCSNCTYKNPGKYQSLLYRTKTDSDWRDWEFVSVSLSAILQRFC